MVVLQPQGSKLLLEGTGKGGKNDKQIGCPGTMTICSTDGRHQKGEHFGKNSCLYCNHWPLNAWRGNEKVGTFLICPTKKVLGSKSF